MGGGDKGGIGNQSDNCGDNRKSIVVDENDKAVSGSERKDDKEEGDKALRKAPVVVTETTNANGDNGHHGTTGTGGGTLPDCETRLWIGNLDPRLRE